MVSDVEIVTWEDYIKGVYEKKHRLDYGSSTLALTKEHVKALNKGLVIACNDGEYCNFVVIEREGK